MGAAHGWNGGRDEVASHPRKVRVPVDLYRRLQQAAEAYQVEGGVSGVVRRAFRAIASGRVAGAPNATRATPTCGRLVLWGPRGRDSTVLTVFLPKHLSIWVDGMTGEELCLGLQAYLDLPRPAPSRPYVDPAEARMGYVVVPMEAEA